MRSAIALERPPFFFPPDLRRNSGPFSGSEDLRLRIAGGYLPSYAGRSDYGCVRFPDGCKAAKKKPSEYLRQLYFDSMVFTSEGLRHLVAECGASQIMIGTDYPFPWSTTTVDHVLNTPSLSDADKRAILGETAAKLLRIPG